MHAPTYTIACLISIGLFAMVRSSIEPAAMAGVAAVLIAAIGVPHGGLDHWVGRRKLKPKLGHLWMPTFFGSYLTVAVLVAILWVAFPAATIVTFVVISAWHFGREDTLRMTGGWGSHLIATATGGVVIWVPAIVRPAEMRSLLLPLTGGSIDSAEMTVWVTAWIAAVMLPLAWFAWWQRTRSVHEGMLFPVTVLAASVLPILVSFTLYFCGWHSIRGLKRLRRSENLEWLEFGFAVAPLSVLAVIGITATGMCVGGISALTLTDSSILQMTFIGLASIAVPHVAVHELLEDNASVEPG